VRALAFDPELDATVDEVREAIRWELRDEHEVARNRWDDLVAGGGTGPGTDARVLLAWTRVVDEGALDAAKQAAEVVETLRVAGDLLDAAEGFDGPARGVLAPGDARFLAEWLVPAALRRALEREDPELATTGATFAQELAVGRELERGYRDRDEPWDFGAVSLGILHGVLEAKYARAFRLAARVGARVAGAPEHAQALAGSVGEAAGMAAGYYVALTQDWDERVQEREVHRKRLVEDGKRAVGDLRTSLGLVRIQKDLGYFVQPFERWAEDLWEALDAVDLT